MKYSPLVAFMFILLAISFSASSAMKYLIILEFLLLLSLSQIMSNHSNDIANSLIMFVLISYAVMSSALGLVSVTSVSLKRGSDQTKFLTLL